MQYLDFDLAIEPSGDGYAARVFHSPGGQASADFTVPFSDLEIENFLLRVGRSRRTVRRIESPELTSAKIFGGRLFNSVFSGDVRGVLRSSLDEAQRQNAGLRVRLHLAKAPALADLPWEFLYNGPMNRFLGLSVETPLVRFLELPERIRPMTVKPPLRVLLMIASPTDYPQLDVTRESTKMSGALAELESRGLVAVDRLEAATLAELQKTLRGSQYHIFHFIGHGGFDEAAQDGVLVLEDGEERGRRVSAQFLGTLLHDHRPLRLAVLNACEGARASRHDPFAGTAQTLVQQGIPAVIAMQFEITDEAAICFTREFYAALAIGYPVDAALAEARKAIFAEVSEIEWGTPVLYMRSPDGRIFDVEQVSEIDRRQRQISSLLAAARTAAASNDDASATARLDELLALDPAHAEGQALRREIERQGEIAEARSRRLGDLQRSGSFAMSQERWQEAIDCWQSLLALAPDDQETRARLAEARRQQELDRLYSRGRSHYELRHWREALVEFHQIQRIQSPYKDVAALVESIERETEKAAAAPPPAVKAGSAALPVTPLPSGRPRAIVPPDGGRPLGAVGAAGVSAPARARPFVMGGLVGAGVVVAGIIGLLVLVAVWQLDNPQPTPNPEPEPIVGPGPAPTPTPVDDDGGGGVPAPPAPAPVPPPAPVNGDPVAAVRQQIEQVIRAGINNEVQALAALNPASLQSTHTGALLQEQLLAITTLRGNGIESAAFDVRDVAITDVRIAGDQAEADVTLRYESNLFSGGVCVLHFHSQVLPQTISLARMGNRWMMVRGQNHAPDPAPVPCH